MLRLSLGNAGFVLRRKEKIEYKKDYENFKLKMTIILLTLSCVNLLLLEYKWMDALHSFMLLYYYSSITMREHILHVNGSNIRLWWIIHHYLSEKRE